MGAVFAAAVVLAVLADQLSKRAVLASDVARVHNVRGALVALPPRAAAVGWCAVAGGVAALVVLAGTPPVATVGLGLVVGGAAGNLADRLARGAVLDFIRLGRWPAFNLADVAMVAGTALVAGSALA